jgi:hypothetical protein
MTLNTKMAWLRARCRKGERLFASIPHGHWRTTTFVAGLRLGGLDAPMVIDGPMAPMIRDPKGIWWTAGERGSAVSCGARGRQWP